LPTDEFKHLKEVLAQIDKSQLIRINYYNSDIEEHKKEVYSSGRIKGFLPNGIALYTHPWLINRWMLILYRRMISVAGIHITKGSEPLREEKIWSAN